VICDSIHFPNVNEGCLEAVAHFLVEEQKCLILLAKNAPTATVEALIASLDEI